MGYQNVWTDTLWLGGVPYPPGAEIPATADPAQLRAFVASGVVQPLTAPAAPPAPEELRRIDSSEAVIGVPDGDDGS